MLRPSAWEEGHISIRRPRQLDARLKGRHGSRRAWPGGLPVDSLVARAERFFVPDEIAPDGDLDHRAIQLRYLRVVGAIAGASVLFFVPSMVVAGVPPDRWPIFTAGVVVAAVVISWSLLAVRSSSPSSLVAAAADSVVIAGLGWLLGDYYQQLPLLYAVVVAGQTTVNGIRPALVMVACGTFLVPIAITSRGGASLSDLGYAFLYLLGVAVIPWIHVRLGSRGSSALRAAAAKYKELVERVPAIVYAADFGADGAWRFVSPRVEELLGFSAETWTHDPGFWWSRVHPDDRDRVLADEIESSGLPAGMRSTFEYRMIDHAGRVRWVRDEAVVVVPEDGSPSHWSGFLVDVTDRRALEEQLQHQAFHDPLTGLANRALFTDRVGHALARSARSRSSLAVLFLDLDDFKMVNDGMGHDAGDTLLVAVGEALQACLRPMDTAARLGGDEFAVLLEDLEGTEAAGEVADRILGALAHPFPIGGRQVVIGASIGIAGPTTRREGAAEILRNADSAMYAAKREGKGRHETYAPAMHAAAVERLELTGEMRRALERGEFDVHYQPVVRLGDGSISGFEALVRWSHPRRGLVLPGEFISAAEDTGQIVAIGRHVLQVACLQARAWQEATGGAPALTMSVNVSARQFRDPSLCASVAAALAAAGMEPSTLVLEITESIIMEDSEAALRRLRELKALGVRLAIDDFGTGYSSLSYLRRLPVDVLKMDKSFIHGIGSGGDAYALASMIVRMGETLHLEVVAEGVEQSSQAAALRRMGCGLAQGYHFARPMAAADLGVFLAQAARGLPRAG